MSRRAGLLLLAIFNVNVFLALISDLDLLEIVTLNALMFLWALLLIVVFESLIDEYLVVILKSINDK
jgi:hypothetical protein